MDVTLRLDWSFTSRERAVEAAHRVDRDGVETVVTGDGIEGTWQMQTVLVFELRPRADRAWLEPYFEGRLDGLQSEHARLLADLDPTYDGGQLSFESPEPELA